jgi:hypothetical protein
LGALLLVNYPAVLHTLWRVVRPWLHTTTRNKIFFLESQQQLLSYFEREQLPVCFGGESKFQPEGLSFGYETIVPNMTLASTTYTFVNSSNSLHGSLTTSSTSWNNSASSNSNNSNPNVNSNTLHGSYSISNVAGVASSGSGSTTSTAATTNTVQSSSSSTTSANTASLSSGSVSLPSVVAVSAAVQRTISPPTPMPTSYLSSAIAASTTGGGHQTNIPPQA